MPGSTSGRRRPAIARWRAAVLVLVHLAIAAHVAHWLARGTTLAPVELSEAMELGRRGTINPGLLFFGAALVATAVFGRFLCGWGCHLVALQDASRWLLARAGIRPRPLRSRALAWVPALACFYMFFWPVLFRLASGESAPPLSFVYTTERIWANLPGWGVATATFLVCGFACVYLLGAKGFCTYACPYGALFRAAEQVAPGRVRLAGNCTACGQCTAACTSNVRVRDEVRQLGMVVDPGCVKCLNCVSVCPQRALAFGWGRPSLFTLRARAATARAPALGARDELVLAAVFVAAFFALRGLLRVFPFLLTLALSTCLAFLALVARRLARDRHVALRSIGLKRDGRLLAPGWCFVGLVAALLGAGTLWAICTNPRSGPDVVVFELTTPNNYTPGAAVGGKRAYSLGTKSWNRGDADLVWFANTNQHPVIGQALYRWKSDTERPGGRFEQVGLSWVKHGFNALAGADAGCSCTFEAGHTSGSWLGQGCTDPYTAAHNADRTHLGPRSEIDAASGSFPYPFDGSAPVDDAIDRRLQVADADMDPALNPGARYFAEAHYVTPDDAAAGNALDNASFREVVVSDATSRSIAYAASGPFAATQIGLTALAAWPLLDGAVAWETVDVVADGRLELAVKAHDLGGGSWRYEYALHNLSSHRSVQRFEVPVPAGSALSGSGFHGVDSHSGEPYSNADWTIDVDSPNGRIAWFGETEAENGDANALRWGATYNFWFDSDQPPGPGLVTVTLFRAPAPGEPSSFPVNLPVPGGAGLFADGFESGTASAWEVSGEP